MLAARSPYLHISAMKQTRCDVQTAVACTYHSTDRVVSVTVLTTMSHNSVADLIKRSEIDARRTADSWHTRQ